jgi:hypothetical protein
MVDDDKRALDLLRNSGSDMSQVHPFDFFLYHQDEMGARILCNHLEVEGFLVSVRESESYNEWLCLASLSFIPSIESLRDHQALINSIVEEFGGEYDGWETIVIPK